MQRYTLSNDGTMFYRTDEVERINGQQFHWIEDYEGEDAHDNDTWVRYADAEKAISRAEQCHEATTVHMHKERQRAEQAEAEAEKASRDFQAARDAHDRRMAELHKANAQIAALRAALDDEKGDFNGYGEWIIDSETIAILKDTAAAEGYEEGYKAALEEVIKALPPGSIHAADIVRQLAEEGGE